MKRGLFTKHISRGIIVAFDLWIYMRITPGGLSKSQNISEYCDWYRRQQWCWSIVGIRLCKRTADGRQTSSSHSSYKKGHDQKKREKSRESRVSSSPREKRNFGENLKIVHSFNHFVVIFFFLGRSLFPFYY